MGPKKEKKKRTKDPLRPKRPTSAYFYFAKFCREELHAKGGSIHRVGDFTKEVSARWKSVLDKTEYQEKAAEDKKRFDAEMAVYKGNKGPKKKRAATAYFHFLADFRKRPENNKVHIKEVTKLAGAHWRKLADDEKKPYVEKYEAQRKQIQEEEARAHAAAGAVGALPAAAVASGAAGRSVDPMADEDLGEEDEDDFQDDEDDYDDEGDE